MQPLGAVVLVGLAYWPGRSRSGSSSLGSPGPRTHGRPGSGRTGGTNALRAMGRKLAAIVVLGDLAKGAVPVLVARWVTGGDPALEAACGVAAVIGSARSIFLGFHGGRGVATGVGTMLVIQPLAVILAAPVFIGVILITRYVSLGSLLGSAAMIPAVALVFLVLNGTVPPAYLLYAVVGRRRRLDRPRRQHRSAPPRHGAQVRPGAAERRRRRRRRLTSSGRGRASCGSSPRLAEVVRLWLGVLPDVGLDPVDHRPLDADSVGQLRGLALASGDLSGRLVSSQGVGRDHQRKNQWTNEAIGVQRGERRATSPVRGVDHGQPGDKGNDSRHDRAKADPGLLSYTTGDISDNGDPGYPDEWG